MSVSYIWGTTANERELIFPCDRYLKTSHTYFRGVTIQANAVIIFRWLCQLRVAPYSYDWLDNKGRQSPKSLTPGLENLEIGQTVMDIFQLIEFESNSHLTLKLKPTSHLVVDTVVSYFIIPQSENSCRLLVKFTAQYHSSWKGWLMSKLLPWGDLVMMRKQLLTLKRLAEETFQSSIT